MTHKIKYARCPKCGKRYDESMSALSRRDNRTLICPQCGTDEAFEDFGRATGVIMRRV